MKRVTSIMKSIFAVHAPPSVARTARKTGYAHSSKSSGSNSNSKCKGVRKEERKNTFVVERRRTRKKKVSL